MRDPGDECQCKECERLRWQDILNNERWDHEMDMRHYKKQMQEDFQDEVNEYARVIHRSRD